MTFLYNICIQPIYIIIQTVFVLLWRLFRQSWCAVIGVSLTVCFLTAPIYKRADELQDEERKKQKEMEPHVAHIKKYFKGDERFMMLSTYYRQVDYHPIYVFKQSISLLLQIPFFMAAYAYLSDLYLLNNEAFGPIKDLSAPDALICVGGFTINVLPIIMTLISLVSGFLYTKGFSLREKFQVFLLPLLFLIILYNSPSGLVLYWTMNNVFSFLRIIFTKVIRIPKKAVYALLSVGVPVAAFFVYQKGYATNMRKIAFLIMLVILAQVPLVISVITKVRRKEKAAEQGFAESKMSFKNEHLIYLLGAVLLFILLGVLIPSGVIASSPEEFVDLKTGRNPMGLLVYTAEIFSGYFLIWAGIIVWSLLNGTGKKIGACLMWVAGAACLVDYLFFGKNLGTLYSNLTFAGELSQSSVEKMINALVLLALFVLLIVIYVKKKAASKVILGIMCISLAVLSVFNIVRIGNVLRDGDYTQKLESNDDEFEGMITLSTKGKNVVVIMLDAAISGFVPYIFNERPELKDGFSGFVYYPNTLSHGQATNFATPGLYGGYEYTPDKMNRRKDEKLVDKHNEALKLMPALFSENGYHVTVCDPPYAGYQLISDPAVYEDLDNVDMYLVEGFYNDGEDYGFDDAVELNFIGYSVFKTVPVVLQKLVYDDGYYFTSAFKWGHTAISGDSYMVLKNMDYLTEIRDDDSCNVLLMDNNITHNPQILQLPDYELKSGVDNTGLETRTRKDENGNVLELNTLDRLKFYHANACAYILLSKWFDDLKKAGVYDNTRIIIVSDHGRDLGLFDDIFQGELELTRYNPVLMVKDFNSNGLMKTDDAFMTNADVPVLAMDGLINDPVNPFTGNTVNGDEKYAHDQYVTTASEYDVLVNNGNVFNLSGQPWFSVHDNIFVKENWKNLGSSLDDE